MKRFPMLVALILTFSFGLSFAQSGSIEVTNIDGLWNDGTDWLAPTDITYEITITNNFGENVKGMTNGFAFSGPGTWNSFSAALDATCDICQYFDLVCQIVPSANLTGEDVAAFSTSVMTGPGIADGFSCMVATVTVGLDDDNIGSTYCLDSTFFPPSNTWLWAPGGVPDWGGPYCYEVQPIPNLDPVFTDCPDGGTFDHCDVFSDSYAAEDPDPGESGGIAGVTVNVGSVTGGATGTFSYTPSLGDVGTPVDVVITAEDGLGATGTCEFTLEFTNEAPVCDFDLGPYDVGMGNTFTLVLVGDMVDCDPITGWDVTGVDVAPVGTYDVTGDVFTFNTASGASPTGDGGVTYVFTIEVTDGNLTSTCDVTVNVLVEEPFGITIEKTHGTYQGAHEYVDVVLTQGSEILQGFDLLIAYDASALSFMAALEGAPYSECGWEMFEYRFGPYGNCGNACPSGMVRVVGIAETNNGPNHPSCYTPTIDPVDGATLFTLDFLVTDDRTFECQYVPIRFFWYDCGDNSVAYATNADPVTVNQGVSRYVFEFEGMEITDMYTGFPTYTGYQAECDNEDPEKPDPIPFVLFTNGGVDIICADSIDARGDVNLNGTGYEIADAVLFSNYFVQGIGVFNVNMQGQIAATDVNADGLTLSVADLVYLIRVVLGDAVPYSKLSVVAANYSADAGVVTVDQQMGGAYVVAAGDVTPTLLADNMDMLYSFDGANTHILVWSIVGESFTGDFVSVDNVISVELATAEGAPVAAKAIPSSFDLAQNYPNPFNPTTTIGFSLPANSDYTLTIYNVTGQKVDEFSGTAEAGFHTVTWDAAANASGIYFYKLDADNFTDTKKMVLLK